MSVVMQKPYYQSTQDRFHSFAVRSEAPSLIGKRFKLNERTLATEVVAGDRIAVTIPIGAIINVSSDPASTFNDDQTVEVLWKDRKFELFRCDVNMRGTEINNHELAIAREVDWLAMRGRLFPDVVPELLTFLDFKVTGTDYKFLKSYMQCRMENPPVK